MAESESDHGDQNDPERPRRGLVRRPGGNLCRKIRELSGCGLDDLAEALHQPAQQIGHSLAETGPWRIACLRAGVARVENDDAQAIGPSLFEQRRQRVRRIRRGAGRRELGDRKCREDSEQAVTPSGQATPTALQAPPDGTTGFAIIRSGIRRVARHAGH